MCATDDISGSAAAILTLFLCAVHHESDHIMLKIGEILF